jgi:hypothetical protein
MTAEETHVILAARNLYWAGRSGTTMQEKRALADLANAVSKLELAQRIERNTPRRSVVLRLVK